MEGGWGKINLKDCLTLQRYFASQEEELRQLSDPELVGKMRHYNLETEVCAGVFGFCLTAIIDVTKDLFQRQPSEMDSVVAAYIAGVGLTVGIAVIARGATTAELKDIVGKIAAERESIKVKKGLILSGIEINE